MFSPLPGKFSHFSSFTLSKPFCYNNGCKCAGGSMDRASDSGSEGWGFESLPACHLGSGGLTIHSSARLLFMPKKTRMMRLYFLLSPVFRYNHSRGIPQIRTRRKKIMRKMHPHSSRSAAGPRPCSRTFRLQQTCPDRQWGRQTPHHGACDHRIANGHRRHAEHGKCRRHR